MTLLLAPIKRSTTHKKTHQIYSSHFIEHDTMNTTSIDSEIDFDLPDIIQT